MIENLKSILIGFSRADKTPSSAIRYGLGLARQAEAHVSICALSPEMAVTHAFISEVATRLVEEKNQRLKELARELAEQSRQDALAQGVPCTTEVIHDNYAVLASRFAKRTRIHDLTLFDADPDAMSLGRGLLEEAMFNGGRPVLTVPAGCDTFKIENVMVAWDVSAKAARAVNDALPFLKAAKQVEIVWVSGEKDLSRSVSGADLAPHLARHGINCSVKELPVQNGDAGETLRSQAGLFRADMTVMGAFVHSRLRQLVLGGVTQSMLKHSKVPLLLSF
ncbi:universal stress protein [Microvirga roseola]|uniref:universal stress protein n=1 Tax=Microvirga roseola TaxID=2883126 RepID=UPI001E38E89F|nr:universal stress protein [Microvirga roseola]